jgi:hypothetical protein
MTQRVVIVGATSFPDLDSALHNLLGQPDGARAAR